MGKARETVERFYKLFEKGDLDTLVTMSVPDCTHVGPPGPQDNDEWRKYGESFKKALPDARMDVWEIVESRDHVAVQGRFIGTHEGPLTTPQGEVPPSGKTVDLPFADFFRIKDGKIAAHHTYFDQVAMMAQLGVEPGS